MGEPETLGEYRALWAILAGEESSGVAYLDEKIAEQGADEKVIAAPSQMMVLFADFLRKDAPAEAAPVAEEVPDAS